MPTLHSLEGTTVLHSFLFEYDQDGICLFFKRKGDKMSGVARYIQVCFHARMSNESHLAARLACELHQMIDNVPHIIHKRPSDLNFCQIVLG